MQNSIITRVEIIPIMPKQGLVAFANVVLEDKIAINGIGIHTCLSRGGYRLVYPDKVLPNGKIVQICYPLSRDMADLIKEAIINKYDELLNRVD